MKNTSKDVLRRTIVSLLKASVAISFTLLLAACGDGGGSTRGTEPAEDVEGADAADIMAGSFDDLPVCTDKREKAVAYVKDEKNAYVCMNGDWVVDDGSLDSRRSSPPTTIVGENDEDERENKDGSSSSRHFPLDGESSSSSIDSTESSSSVILSGSEGSSSSAVELNCSAILETEVGWSWNVPKECRFNTDISYGTMTDSRDNKVYRTVKIGYQIWMAENLNYSDSIATPSLKGRHWCHKNVAANCAVAGRLYTWAAAIDSVKLYDGGNGVECGYGKTCTLPAKVRGICPNGWHLPTYTEWQALFTAVGGQSNAGRVLKSQTGWYISDRYDATDAYGFSALPAGNRHNNGNLQDVGTEAYFWSVTEHEDRGSHAYYMNMHYDSDEAGLYSFIKLFGSSVRCLQD